MLRFLRGESKLICELSLPELKNIRLLAARKSPVILRLEAKVS